MGLSDNPVGRPPKPRPTTITFDTGWPGLCKVKTLEPNLTAKLSVMLLGQKSRPTPEDPTPGFVPFVGTHVKQRRWKCVFPWEDRPSWNSQEEEQAETEPCPFQEFFLPVAFLPQVRNVLWGHWSRLTEVPLTSPLPVPRVTLAYNPVDNLGRAFLDAVRNSPRGLIDCGGDTEMAKKLLTWLIPPFQTSDFLIVATSQAELEDLFDWFSDAGQSFELIEDEGSASLLHSINLDEEISRRLILPQGQKGKKPWIWPGGRDLLVAMDAVGAATVNPRRLVRCDRVYGFVQDFQKLNSVEAMTAMRCFGNVIFRVA